LGQRGFTLVEILVATALTLLMMGMVVTIFALVTDSISGSSAALEVADRLRAVKDTLQTDLEGITATLAPPRDPKNDEGYFEYIEGPVGPIYSAEDFVVDENGNADTSGLVGDLDDVLMFTTRSRGTPFTGRWLGSATGAAQSQVAEVCWFMRGTTLYRRVLLVMPSHSDPLPTETSPPAQGFLGFYANYDVSVHQVGGDRFDISGRLNPSDPATRPELRLVANSLGDLTKREYRYGHQPFAYPHDARFWGPLGLPTMRECSSYRQDTAGGAFSWFWPFPVQQDNPAVFPKYDDSVVEVVPVKGPTGTALERKLIAPVTQPVSGAPSLLFNMNTTAGVLELAIPAQADRFDATTRQYPWFDRSGRVACDRVSGGLADYVLDPDNDPTSYPNFGSTRLIDDVVMTNVISFDVEVWDPGAPLIQLADSSTGKVFSDASGTPVVFGPGDHAYLRRDTASGSVTGALRYLAESSTDPVPTVVGYGAYVDLNYMAWLNGISATYAAPAGYPEAQFRGPGILPTAVAGFVPTAAHVTTLPTQVMPSFYDTWSTHYESDGLDQDNDGTVDEGTNGFDDDMGNGVDDSGEKEAPAPYPYPLRGLRVKIRAYEPNSRQVREVTIVQQFTDR